MEVQFWQRSSVPNTSIQLTPVFWCLTNDRIPKVHRVGGLPAGWYRKYAKSYPEILTTHLMNSSGAPFMLIMIVTSTRLRILIMKLFNPWWFKLFGGYHIDGKKMKKINDSTIPHWSLEAHEISWLKEKIWWGIDMSHRANASKIY